MVRGNEMKTKIHVKKISATETDSVSILFGVETQRGVSITFEVVEGGAGMLYSGHNECCPIKGRKYTFFYKNATEGEALYALQQAAETENFHLVSEKEKVEKWDGKAQEWTEFDLEELDALARKNFVSAEDALKSLRGYGKALNGLLRTANKYSNPEQRIAEGDVVNLTQHPATAEQVVAGVVEPENKAAVQAALTFDAIPSGEEMAQRANFLAAIAKESGCTKAMIGGAPFFMSALESALKDVGIVPLYAFSVRDSREEPDGNGGVRKVAVFKHVGFVEV